MEILIFIFILFCLFVADIIITSIINKYLDTLGHKESFPFDTFSLIFYIMDCVKIQKETGDKKLKKLLFLLVACHAASIILFGSMIFYYWIWPCL